MGNESIPQRTSSRFLLAAAALSFSLLVPTGAATTLPLELISKPGPNPWMNLQALPDSEEFQFAIVADRSGGARPEVFRDAIGKLNLLRPDFVMSVGDLIPGYTNNPRVLDRQWYELLKDLRSLKAPFFFVPGNHDLSNDLQTTEWHNRFGRTYYHFTCRDCLFLVLNSETTSGKRLTREQINYFHEVIKEHPDSRWTFVFLHGPLWLPEYERAARKNMASTLWSEFEELLKGRSCTVFAGHLHDYSSYERNGQHYYILATTGGGNALRGAENYGEMDHVVWVTMTGDGPVIANIETGGIHDEDLRTGVERRLQGLSGRAVRVRSVSLSGRKQGAVRTQLLLRNDSAFPMHVTVDFDPRNRARVQPEEIERTLAPMTTATEELAIDVNVPSGEAAPGPVVFSWAARYDQADRKPVEFSGRRAIGVERASECARIAVPVNIDGKLTEWGRLRLTSADSQMLVAPGAKPRRRRQAGSFRFTTRHDDRYVYVALQMNDRRLVTDPDREPWEQDGVEIRLDARPDPERSAGRGEGEGTETLVVAISPGSSDDKPTSYGVDRLPAGSRIACVRNARGYAVELAIPASYLDGKQKGHWQAFRLNVAATDHHRNDWRDPVRLAWRPDWRSELNYPGSGTFLQR